MRKVELGMGVKELPLSELTKLSKKGNSMKFSVAEVIIL